MARYQLCVDKQFLEGTIADLVVPAMINYPTEESALRAFGAMRSVARASAVLHEVGTGRRFIPANVHLVDCATV